MLTPPHAAPNRTARGGGPLARRISPALDQSLKVRIHLVAAAIFFAFLLAFRLRLPNEHHEDFRHIFPVLVLFCLGYVKSIEHFGRRSKIFRHAGVAVGLLMVTSSVAFFVRAP